MARPAFPALAVSALVAWSLLAFGGVYPWAALPIVIGTALLAVLRPPRFGGSHAWRILDGALLLMLLAAAAQLVPLPAGVTAWLSPHRHAVEAALRVDAGLGPLARTARPLTLASAETTYALALVAAIALLFWTTRTALAEGGARRVARMVSWLGLAASLGAIAQRALSPGEIYGFWRPLEHSAQPFGPFVNRNHFASWLLMALPMCLGYLAAHAETHRSRRPLPFSFIRELRSADPRVLWLAASGALMLLVLVLSTSRAALLSLAASTTFGLWLGRRRRGAGGRAALAGYAVLAAAVLLAWANFGAVVARLDDLLASSPGGRTLVWRTTLAMIRDFWLTGVGLGSYQTAMTVYQTTVREYFFNHAHSQYLQLAAEGGLFLSVPAAAAAVAFAAAARERLRRDTSPMWHVRAGAVVGLLGLAVQSIWECGLLAPANGVLMAVAAALVLHRSPVGGDTRS